MIIVDNCNAPLSLERMEAFEKEIGFEIPTSYKTFAMEYAGVVPLERFFYCDGGLDALEWFYMFWSNNKHAETVESMYYRLNGVIEESYGEYLLDDDNMGIIPSWYGAWLPLATTYGDVFCIKLSGDKIGAIGHCSTSGELEFVSPSLEDFINSLIPDPRNK